MSHLFESESMSSLISEPTILVVVRNQGSAVGATDASSIECGVRNVRSTVRRSRTACAARPALETRNNRSNWLEQPVIVFFGLLESRWPTNLESGGSLTIQPQRASGHAHRRLSCLAPLAKRTGVQDITRQEPAARPIYCLPHLCRDTN